MFAAYAHQPPTARQHADAVAVVHNPALVQDQPALRANAWGVLMAERGHRVNYVRLSAMQYELRSTACVGAGLTTPRGVV